MRLAIPGHSWRSLDFAINGATFVTLFAFSALSRPGGAPITDVLPILIGAAAVLAALLIRGSAPSLAWLALIGGSLVASSLPFDRARVADPTDLGADEWSVLAGRASGIALMTLLIAVAYATRRGRRLEPWTAPVAVGLWLWVAIASTTTIGLVLSGQARADPAFTWVDVGTAPLTVFLHIVMFVTALGIAADVRAGMRRAIERGGAETLGDWTIERLRLVLLATLRELVPGQSAAEEATVAAERTRLASDLHATVLPGLRRAIAEAESGGDPDALARQLRTVDLELERLMADRWPVVLEAFGLVAALEDLAELVETDSGLAVQIDVERAGERPPPAIERAAWRVAQLAIDNAARHAEASAITVTVAVGADRVALAIADDGRGFDLSAGGAVRPGARGLADATRRAAAVGATIRVEPRSGGGTTVAFDWVANRT